MKMRKKLVGEAPPQGRRGDRAVQLAGVVLRRPPAKLRRGGGASMVGEVVELLHGLELERGGEWSEWE